MCLQDRYQNWSFIIWYALGIADCWMIYIVVSIAATKRKGGINVLEDYGIRLINVYAYAWLNLNSVTKNVGDLIKNWASAVFARPEIKIILIQSYAWRGLQNRSVGTNLLPLFSHYNISFLFWEKNYIYI